MSTRPPKNLLAKKPHGSSPSPRETLLGHTRDVLEAAEALVASIGQQSLANLGLKSDYRVEHLRSALLTAAVLHDLGKANSQFQRMISSPRSTPQAIRHEFISAWLPLRFADLEEWLFAPLSEPLRRCVLSAVLGHHLKVCEGADIEPRPGSGETHVQVFSGHRQFLSCLGLAQKALGLGSNPPQLRDCSIDLLATPLCELDEWLGAALCFHEKSPDCQRRLAALVKALLVAADIAGSAVPKNSSLRPADWAEKVMARTCLEGQLRGIATARLGGRPLRWFQQQVAQSTSRVVFVKAGCGSGKTIAAYLWAAQKARGRKLFFAYPTTGTATEGFRGYVVPAEMSPDSALLHSRSECDIESVLEAEDLDLYKAPVGLEALTAWDVPLVISTVDLPLGIVQNARRSLFCAPALLNGAFVFDEIHQYDDRLFRELLVFLRTFRGCPTLLMTASLPPLRLDALRETLASIGERLAIVEGPAELETIPRYRIEGPENQMPWDVLVEALCERREKILWVANTVSRCVSIAKEAAARGLHPLPYHSRYRYCDRIARHKAVVEAFADERPGPALAITTQVCEVSLDLSADLLVTDLAPTPALIQRMGRLNRRVTPQNPGTPKTAIVLDRDETTPYAKDEFDLETCRSWVASLSGKPLSQADLANSFEALPGGKPPTEVQSAWLDGGPFAWQEPVREATATIPVLRREDAPQCKDNRGRPIPREITRHSIPMPLATVAREIQRWQRLGFAFVAPPGRVCYSEFWGAKWERNA